MIVRIGIIPFRKNKTDIKLIGIKRMAFIMKTIITIFAVFGFIQDLCFFCGFVSFVIEDEKLKKIFSKMIDFFFIIDFILLFFFCIGGIIYCSIKLRFQFITVIKLIFLQYHTECTLTGQNEQYFLYLFRVAFWLSFSLLLRLLLWLLSIFLNLES